MSQTEARTVETDQTSVTAAILVIGDEILSGRTKDKNIGYIAEYLTNIGIDLREVRVVPDVEEEIVAAVNALRSRYTHLFTTGGIGPTHDDITADCVAKAFGVPIDVDERAVKLLLERIPKADLYEARLRMARIPEGADLIENSVSKAPGFSIGNVHVMAGVPTIMQAMLDAVTPRLKTGKKMLSRSFPARAKEGDARCRCVPCRSSSLTSAWAAIRPLRRVSGRPPTSSCAPATRRGSTKPRRRSRRCWSRSISALPERAEAALPEAALPAMRR